MVNISDVRRRISILAEKTSPSINMSTTYNRAMNSSVPSNADIKLCFNEWESLSEDINISAAMSINLFSHLCECDSISITTLDRLCKKICENAVPKFRNAEETQHLIKRRLGRIKTKIQTGINTNINNLKTATNDSIDAIKNNTAKNIDQIKQNADKLKQAADFKKKEEKENKVNEYFISLYNACQDVIICDRIIENHMKISKRFNIDSIINEMSRYSTSYELINEFCKLIDTYNIPLSAKLSIALENGMYLLEKNHIDYDKTTDILDSVIDYNLMNTNEDNYQSIIDKMSSSLSQSNIFDNTGLMESNTFRDLYINNSDVKKFEENAKNAQIGFEHDGCSFSEAYELMKYNIISEDKNNKFIEGITRFKTDVKEKTVESLKALVRKLYTNDPEDIIVGQTSLFTLIRVFFVFTVSCAINPVLPVITLITDQCIAMGMKRKEIDRTITNYKNEIKKTETKLDKLKDEAVKERTKKYLNTLKDGLKKLESYRDDLHTDEENMNRASDDDDDEFDFNFDESTMTDMVYTIKLIEEATENIIDSKFNSTESIVKFVRNNIDKIDSNSIDSISSLFQNPIISNEAIRGSFVNELSMYKNSLRNNKIKPVGEKYSMMACIDDNIRLINSVNESVYTSTINGTDIFREYNNLLSYLEITESIQEMFNYIGMDDNNSPILEMDFANVIKLAADKLKKSVEKLGDAEKTASKNIDVTMNNFKSSIERSMSNDNREAIIKGTVLPSASKTLKLAIGAGATAYLINPVLAIIGVLGYIGTSKKYKAKERQMILDEIEVELQMVDKYMKIADDKDDLQAQKQLLTTKRQLERQQQRIKYHMRVDFGEGDVATTSMDNGDN